MIVVEDKKALVLRLSDPDKILSSIPTAKRLDLNGHNLVAVPHKNDEVKVLRNLGIPAPAPILHYYNWPGRFTPYEHQRLTAAFLTMNKKALVLNDIGTGKTNSALWAADYLIRTKQIRKVLIMSPLSTLERVWADSIFTEFVGRKAVTLHGSAKRRLSLLKTDVDFYIINHDGFPIIREEASGMFDLVIVDEAAVLRNPSTTRFKNVRKYMTENPDCRLWLMTGTPTPNEPTDAWSLAKLVDSPTLDSTYTGFKDKVMMKLGQYRWVPRPSSPEIVMNVLQPAIRFTRDECLDLPDTTYQTRTTKLSPDQETAWKNMVKHLIVEAGSGQITAANEAVKLQKLIQIACGVAYDNTGNMVELDCAPRVNLTVDLIEEAGGKVIVFVPLTGTLHMLERELSKHYTIGVVNGAVSASKRNEIFRAFQHDKDPQVLLAHPATMAHGLTLTSAYSIIWYGPITSNEQYTQANGRVERIGKKHKTSVIHIEATSIEGKIFSRLKDKQKLQGILLDMLEGT